MFGGTNVKITVEDIDKTPRRGQKELFTKSISTIQQFKDVVVDPDLDLSALANEINL